MLPRAVRLQASTASQRQDTPLSTTQSQRFQHQVKREAIAAEQQGLDASTAASDAVLQISTAAAQSAVPHQRQSANPAQHPSQSGSHLPAASKPPGQQHSGRPPLPAQAQSQPHTPETPAQRQDLAHASLCQGLKQRMSRWDCCPGGTAEYVSPRATGNVPKSPQSLRRRTPRWDRCSLSSAIAAIAAAAAKAGTEDHALTMGSQHTELVPQPSFPALATVDTADTAGRHKAIATPKERYAAVAAADASAPHGADVPTVTAVAADLAKANVAAKQVMDVPTEPVTGQTPPSAVLTPNAANTPVSSTPNNPKSLHAHATTVAPASQLASIAAAAKEVEQTLGNPSECGAQAPDQHPCTDVPGSVVSPAPGSPTPAPLDQSHPAVLRAGTQSADGSFPAAKQRPTCHCPSGAAHPECSGGAPPNLQSSPAAVSRSSLKEPVQVTGTTVAEQQPSNGTSHEMDSACKVLQSQPPVSAAGKQGMGAAPPATAAGKILTAQCYHEARLQLIIACRTRCPSLRASMAPST